MIVHDERSGHALIVAHRTRDVLLVFPDLPAISGKGPTTRRALLRSFDADMQFDEGADQ
jgi:hypothetical protein